MVQRLRWNVFNAIIKQDKSFFDENRTGELTNRSFIIGKRLAFNDRLFSGMLGILVAAGTSAVLW
jgi:ABC-type multidrug transport system fused ATPase/permease subunit